MGEGQEVEERRKERRETVQELRTAAGGRPELLSTGTRVPSRHFFPGILIKKVA